MVGTAEPHPPLYCKYVMLGFSTGLILAGASPPHPPRILYRRVFLFFCFLFIPLVRLLLDLPRLNKESKLLKVFIIKYKIIIKYYNNFITSINKFYFIILVKYLCQYYYYLMM